MEAIDNGTGKKVAIFTTFTSADPAYSLNRVVEDQIKMLLRGGYEVKVLVAQGFQAVGVYKHVELVEIPNVPCHNELRKDETFDEDVQSLSDALKTALLDVEVVLTHDIVYQPACLKHNFAARKFAQDNPSVRWLHWIHSATAPYRLQALTGMFTDAYLDLVRKEFPNSYYIFFNDYSKPRIAENFGISEDKVKTVHHPIDLCGFFSTDPLATRFIEDKQLYLADAVCIYPCRLDRGKQVEYVIKTMAMLKDFGLSVRVVVMDFHSTAGDKVKYRDELKSTGIDWGLNSRELSFTSEYDPAWMVQAPSKVVRDLQMFANVFIMPSVSESYSLVTQEAAALGKVLVLNFDFPPFRDIFGSGAIFRKYSSNIDVMTGMDGDTSTKYGPGNASDQERKFHEKNYHRETAGMIANRLLTYENLVTQRKVFKERNLDTVFKKELEPLFY